VVNTRTQVDKIKRAKT